MTEQVEFINKKTGHKVVIGWKDAIRIRCLKRAGYVSAGEYVAPPLPEEPTPEPTVGEVVEAIAEENPEPEDVPMVAVEAVHEAVDPAEFTQLLDPPESEESDGEGNQEVESGDEDFEDGKLSERLYDEFLENDLERTVGDTGGEISDPDSIGFEDTTGGTVDPPEPA